MYLKLVWQTRKEIRDKGVLLLYLSWSFLKFLEIARKSRTSTVPFFSHTGGWILGLPYFDDQHYIENNCSKLVIYIIYSHIQKNILTTVF